MRRKSKYDLNTPWDDPYERKGERRTNDRCIETFKIKLGVRVPDHKSLLVGEGVVENISQGGLYCKTKHHLTVGQEVHLSISTKNYSGGRNFPLKFIGVAKVCRIHEVSDDLTEAGLAFGSDLSEDMSFSLFIEALQSISELKASL